MMETKGSHPEFASITNQIEELENTIKGVEENIKDLRAEADKTDLTKLVEALQKEKEALMQSLVLQNQFITPGDDTTTPSPADQQQKLQEDSNLVTGKLSCSFSRHFFRHFYASITYSQSSELFQVLIERNQQLGFDIVKKKVELKKATNRQKDCIAAVNALEAEHGRLKEEIRKCILEIETRHPSYFRDSHSEHLSVINGGKPNNLIIAELMLEDSELDPRTPALSGILHFGKGFVYLESILRKQLGDGFDKMWKEAQKVALNFKEDSTKAADELMVVKEIRAFLESNPHLPESEKISQLSKRLATLHHRVYAEEGDSTLQRRRKQRDELYAVQLLMHFLYFYSLGSDSQLLCGDNTEYWTESNAIVPWLDRCLQSIPNTMIHRGEKMGVASQLRRSRGGAAGMGKRIDMCLETTLLCPNVELFVVASTNTTDEIVNDTYKLLRVLKDMRDRIYQHYDIQQDFCLYGIQSTGLEVQFYLYDKMLVDASRAIHLASVVLPDKVDNIGYLLDAIGMALTLRNRIENSMIQLERKRDQTISPEGPATCRSLKDSFLGERLSYDDISFQ